MEKTNEESEKMRKLLFLILLFTIILYGCATHTTDKVPSSIIDISETSKPGQDHNAPFTEDQLIDELMEDKVISDALDNLEKVDFTLIK
jgi:PBP1b-binding outer membrane lipoprotein LpoB